MGKFKIANRGSIFNKFYLGGDTFIIPSKDKPDGDNTTINLSIDVENNTFTVSLSNVSPHIQYLMNNNRLGVCLVVGRTDKKSPDFYARDITGEPKMGRYTARTYYPQESITSDVYRVTTAQETTYSHEYSYYDCQKLHYIFYWANENENPARPTGWLTYKAMLCLLPKYSGADSQVFTKSDLGPCIRGFKKSETSYVVTFENEE